MSNTNMSIRMDSEVKERAEKLFAEFGLNMTTAINMFLRQSIRQQSIPFDLTLNIPNAETIEAMREADRISRDSTVKRYSKFSDLLTEVQNEV